MKRKCFVLFAMTLVCTGKAFSSSTSFRDCTQFIDEKRFDQVPKILENWGQKRSDDPQYHICLFNYHLNKAFDEVIVVRKGSPPSGQTLELKDTKSGAPVGYIGSTHQYDSKESEAALKAIREGIKKFPDHLEMRFGLLYFLSELGQFKAYLAEMEDTLGFFAKNPKRTYYWNNNEKLKDPADRILETVQGNISGLSNPEDGSEPNSKFLVQLVELQIHYFPKHKYGYSNRGALLARAKNFKEAIPWFEKAFAIDNKDQLIAMNLGIAYEKTNNIPKAVELYKVVVALNPDSNMAAQAKEGLKDLQKKN